VILTMLASREMARGGVASVELKQSVTGMCQVADIFSNELWALWVIAAISP